VLKNNKFSCYFDNVGENLLDSILKHIEIGGRIALCGAIANYNNYSNRGISNIGLIISKRLTLRGLAFMQKIT
jgi:NADPH-dependent curcumin reductase CurA